MRDVRFESLVREHHRAVHTFARSLTASPSLAEEATQETFCRAWRYLDSFRGDGSFEGWLLRICRNVVIDLADRERRAPAPAAEADLGDVVHRVLPVAEAPDHSHDVLDLVAMLSPEQREVVGLCGLLGYDYDTAARVLDVPVGTVRSRLHRARSSLAALLASDERASA